MGLADVEKRFSERMQYKAIDHKREIMRMNTGKEGRKPGTRAFSQHVTKKGSIDETTEDVNENVNEK